MIGMKEDPGIVPLASTEIFERIKKIEKQQQDKNTPENECIFYDVKVSMMEIYNEEVRDLLNPQGTKPGGLKVRESTVTGPYVEDLIYEKVNSYVEIEKTMDQGTEMRTVRSTKMNDKSSRAHTLIQIVLSQKRINPKKGEEKFKIFKESRINLVDLAGAEKQKHTGTSGEGMQEGIAINKSLSYLGKCITALAEKAQGRGKKIVVPFRESKLTYIMKNSLGGNSKTIMIAAIRPGADYFTESLSTLRYADQAKKIKNKAIINEDPRDRAIKQLKEEIMKLKSQLTSGSGGSDGVSDGIDPDEVNSLREELLRSQQIINDLQNSDDADARAEEMARLRAAALASSGIAPKFDRTTIPHILNLQEDPQQTGIIAYPLDKIDNMVVGRTVGDEKPDIILSGLGIQKKHAIIRRSKDNKLYIKSLNGSSVHHNGNIVKDDETEMFHNDRLIIGNNHVFRIVNPLEPNSSEKSTEEFDWEFAQKEYATAQGHLHTAANEEKQKEMEEKMKKMEEEFQRQQKEKEAELERKKKEMEEEMIRKQKELEKSAEDSAALKALQEILAKQQEEIARKEQEMEELRKNQEEQKSKLQEEKKQQEFNNWLEKKILELLPLVKDANEISKELGKQFEYELKVIHTFDEVTGAPVSKLGIVNKEKKTGLTSVWQDDEFTDRLYKMKAVYGEYLDAVENKQEWKGVSAEDDPFEDEKIDEAQSVGHSNILMKSLTYIIENDFYADILDMTGSVVGELAVELIPCDESGDPDGVFDMLNIPLDADTDFLENPPDLVGKKFCFKLKITGAKGLNPNRCEDAYCRYRLPIDSQWYETNIFPEKNVNPNWNYERLVVVDSVSPAFQDWLNNNMLKVEVFAKQVVNESDGVKRKGLKEFKAEAEELKKARDEIKINLTYIMEERDDLQKENVNLLSELEQVLQELEEIQTGFFLDNGSSNDLSKLARQSSRPALTRGASSSALASEELQKLKARIVELENKKTDLEKELETVKSVPPQTVIESPITPQSLQIDDDLIKKSKELEEKNELLRIKEEELARKELELKQRDEEIAKKLQGINSTIALKESETILPISTSTATVVPNVSVSTPIVSPVPSQVIPSQVVSNPIAQTVTPTSLAEAELEILKKKNELMQQQLELERQKASSKSGVCIIS